MTASHKMCSPKYNFLIQTNYSFFNSFIMLPSKITSPLIADYTELTINSFFNSTVYWQPIVDNLARPEAFTLIPIKDFLSRAH